MIISATFGGTASIKKSGDPDVPEVSRRVHDTVGGFGPMPSRVTRQFGVLSNVARLLTC